MYKKELMESGRQALMTILLLIIIPVFYIFDKFFINTGLDYTKVVVMGLGLVISIITLIYTSSVFQAEQRDHAMEYLLSLPVSRYSIIGWKLIPRIFILATLYVIFLAIQPSGRDVFAGGPSIFIHPTMLPMVIFTLLIFGFILGLIGHKNSFMKVFIIISFYAVIGGAAGLVANFIDISKDEFRLEGVAPCFWISTGVILLIYWLSFSPVFRRFDLKPEQLHVRRFAFRAVPLLAGYILMAIAFLVINNGAK
jgi:hypothetical protein